MRRRKSGLILVLTISLLAACTKPPDEEAMNTTKDPAPEETAVTTIRVLNLGGTGFADGLISAYHKRYPTDRVEMVTIPGGAEAVNISSLVVGKVEQGEVDIVPYVSSELVKQNMVLPLDPLIQQDGFDLKPYGPGIETLRWEGKLHRLPSAVTPNLLIYNKAMFQEAGIAPPTPDWTWDDLRVAAQKLTQGEGDQKIWGFSPDSADAVVSMYLNLAETPPIEAYQDERLVKDLFQYFGTLTQVDQSMPQSERRAYGDITPRRDRPDFIDGRAAMAITGVGMLPHIVGRPTVASVDVAPVPSRPGTRPYTLVHPTSWAIAANSPNQEAAWRFLRFLAGPEGAEIVAKAGTVPAYISPAVKEAWFDRQPAPPPGTAFLFETEWDYGNRPWANEVVSEEELARRRPIFAAVFDNLNAIMAGEKSWEDGFADYQVTLKEFRAANQGG